jgi:peptidoglycan/LPS O-acetylase OafA/YrhL
MDRSHAQPIAETGWRHRPALDGIRAIAVYLVVAYHAGVPSLTGGFVGVDLFFVLSGFLVTSVLLDEHRRTGGIDLAGFYARRVRRLLPAAVLAIVGGATLSVIVDDRLTRMGYVADARSALLYVANWHFYAASTDYFASDVQHSPFLHLWSLAIEEQFYAVFPVVLLLLMTVQRRVLRRVPIAVGLALLCSASLLVQTLVARSDPLRAYYATDTRLYQLLAGATLAAAWRGWSARSGGLLATTGLAGIVLVASSWVGSSVSARGMLATATAVTLIAGLELAPHGWAARRLSSSPLCYLGRISYSTYLWHWPLIVLSRPLVDLDPWRMTAVVAVGATALAALSEQLVETPIRRGALLIAHPRAVIAGGMSVALATALIVVPGILDDQARPALAIRPSGLVGATRTTVDQAALATALAAAPPPIDLEPTEPPPFDRSHCTPDNPDGCVMHTGTGPRVHLLGDSNAQVLVPALEQLAEAHDFTLSVTTWPGCPWQQGLGWDDADQTTVDACIDRRDGWYAEVIPALRPDLLIVTNTPRDAGADGSEPYTATGVADRTGDIEDVVDVATQRTLDEVVAAIPGIRIVILEPLPYGELDPNNCLAGSATVADCAYEANATPLPSEIASRAAADQRDAVFSVDYDDIACPYVPSCLPAIDGVLVFRNRNHLSNAWIVAHSEALWERIVATGSLSGDAQPRT